MGRMSWAVRALPDGRGEVWRWNLATIAELAAVRSALRSRLEEHFAPYAEQLSAWLGAPVSWRQHEHQPH